VPRKSPGAEISAREILPPSLASNRSGLLAVIDVAADAERAALAQLLCVEAAHAYWIGLQVGVGAAVPFPALPSDYRRGFLGAEATATARAFGSALASLPLADAAHQLGSAYAAMVPAGQRARDGVHYTLPALAARLLDQAEAAGLDWRTARVLDPACGAGAFLVPAAIRMLAALEGADPAIALQSLGGRLQGWELDPTSAWLAQLLVEAVALPLMQATGRRLSQVAAVRDSLIADDAGAFDLVVGNPPFGRVSLPAALRGAHQAAAATVHFLRQHRGGEPRPEAAGRFRLPSDPSDPWLLPRRNEDAPAVLAAFLNTEAADRAFRCLSGSVAVSAYEIEAMPLPTPGALGAFARLVTLGAPRAALDAEAARLYGSDGAAAPRRPISCSCSLRSWRRAAP
jgi:hypothetical protein